MGTNVLDGSPHLLTSDDCTPEKTRIFPVRWNVTADGSGPGGSMRELRLSPDGVTLGWSSYSFTSAGIGQFSYVGRLAFNPAPTTGEPLVPRYELTDVFRLFSPAPDDQPFRLDPDHPGEVLFNPLTRGMGELRGFTSDGKEVIGINHPSEANHVDVFATDLATGATRRLTRTEYTDPIKMSPDDNWFVDLDVNVTGRSMFVGGMPGTASRRTTFSGRGSNGDCRGYAWAGAALIMAECWKSSFAPVWQRRRPEMTTRLANLCFDANDPVRLARLWASALGWEIYDETHDEIGVLPTDGTRFTLAFLPVPEPKTTKNPIHLDLVSESVEHQREIVDRLIELGAQHVDIGQGSDADHVVLADPEGNEFCVVLRGEFLADTDFIGAVVFEPANPATGHFWGEAIGWPVVYDQDGDVAIRAPDGRGPFITFGPPGVAKSGKNRLHLDLAPRADDDQATEVDRLIALGASRIDIGQGDVSWVVLADPDGNEFCVLSPQ